MIPQQVVYIYPDIAFMVSLLMNALILWGTSKLYKSEIRWLRILAGAAAGAVYSFAAAFPQLQFLHFFWLKILFSLVMVAITFAPLKLKAYCTVTAIFYMVSFFLGGIFFGLLYFVQSNPYYSDIYDLSQKISAYFYPALLATLCLFIIWNRFINKFMKKSMVQNFFMVPIKIQFNQIEVQVKALIDTGNRLEDPISRVPVVVVEYKVLKDLFTAEIQSAMEGDREPNLMMVLESVSGTPWYTRFRVIPFTSLGRESGMLIGFRPDQLEVMNMGSTMVTSDVVIGIYRQELSPEGGYRALLHPDLLMLNTA